MKCDSAYLHSASLCSSVLSVVNLLSASALRFGRYTSVAVPRWTSAAKATVSLSVGWGWIDSATSRIVQPISMATTASAISSPAPLPTMPQPSTRSVAGSMIHLVRPSVRPMAIARPLACHGYCATATSRPVRLASSAVRPAQAISGSVNTTAGIAAVLERGRFAGEHFGGHLAFVRRLVGEHRLARHVADRQDVRVGRLLLVVDDDEALFVDFDLGVFEADAAGDGPAADRDQHAVERTVPFAFGAFDLHFDLVAGVFQRDDLRAEMNAGEQLRRSRFSQRLHQVAIGAGQQAVGQFDDGHLASRARRRPCPFRGRCSRRRPPAASSGMSSSVERAGRIHHARRADLEHLRHRGHASRWPGCSGRT